MKTPPKKTVVASNEAQQLALKLTPLQLAQKVVYQAKSLAKLQEVQEGLQRESQRLDMELDEAREALKTFKRQTAAAAGKSKEHIDDLRCQANLVPALRQEIEVLRKRYPLKQLHKFFTKDGKHTDSVPRDLRGKANWIDIIIDRYQTQVHTIQRAESKAKMAVLHANPKKEVGSCECEVCNLRRLLEGKIEEQKDAIIGLKEELQDAQKKLQKGSGKRGKGQKQRKDKR